MAKVIGKSIKDFVYLETEFDEKYIGSVPAECIDIIVTKTGVRMCAHAEGIYIWIDELDVTRALEWI